MTHVPPAGDPSLPPGPGRRGFLARLSGLTMLGGLAAGYGSFAAMAGRFLYPARRQEARWVFVATVADFQPGTSRPFVTPSGARIMVARKPREEGGDFLALSSTCPHLGCQVRFEPQHPRFFCPCHNGVFDPDGRPVSGPPAEAGQSLPTYPLRIEGNRLLIGISQEVAVLGPAPPPGPEGPGHDPCLAPRPRREEA
jgi:cytochrome b6-f complex iron-sulfur subunit